MFDNVCRFLAESFSALEAWLEQHQGWVLFLNPTSKILFWLGFTQLEIAHLEKSIQQLAYTNNKLL